MTPSQLSVTFGTVLTGVAVGIAAFVLYRYSSSFDAASSEEERQKRSNLDNLKRSTDRCGRQTANSQSSPKNDSSCNENKEKKDSCTENTTKKNDVDDSSSKCEAIPGGESSFSAGMYCRAD